MRLKKSEQLTMFIISILIMISILTVYIRSFNADQREALCRAYTLAVFETQQACQAHACDAAMLAIHSAKALETQLTQLEINFSQDPDFKKALLSCQKMQ